MYVIKANASKKSGKLEGSHGLEKAGEGKHVLKTPS